MLPLIGFWNTRPMSAARRHSGQLVTSRPLRRTVPRSSGRLPAMALSSVDLPDPLTPSTTTNAFASMVRSTPWSATCSFGVPGKNVWYRPVASSDRLAHGRTTAPASRRRARATAPGITSAASTKTAVESLSASAGSPATSASATSSRKAMVPNSVPMICRRSVTAAEQALAQHQAGEPGDDHADAHRHVGEALVLREQRAGQRHQAVGEQQRQGHHEAGVEPQRARRLRVPARRAHREAEVGAEEAGQDPDAEQRPRGEHGER